MNFTVTHVVKHNAAVPSKESKFMKDFTSATVIIPVQLTKLIFLSVMSCCGELVLRFVFLNYLK